MKGFAVVCQQTRSPTLYFTSRRFISILSPKDVKGSQLPLTDCSLPWESLSRLHNHGIALLLASLTNYPLWSTAPTGILLYFLALARSASQPSLPCFSQTWSNKRSASFNSCSFISTSLSITYIMYQMCDQKSSKKAQTNEKNFLLFFAYLAVFNFGREQQTGR